MGKTDTTLLYNVCVFFFHSFLNETGEKKSTINSSKKKEEEFMANAFLAQKDAKNIHSYKIY